MKKLLLITLAVLLIGLVPLWFSFGHNWRMCDFVAQQIPFILETKRMLASGTPWWSWNTFTGDNFIGGYSFYTVTSPFVWMACLFPYDKILWGILFSLVLKTLCTSAFSYLYFKKMGFTENLCTLGGILYCFSSFYISNLGYFHFCEPIMIFPLLLISLEMVLHSQKYAYFWCTLAVFGTIFINFYFALPSFLLGILYFLSRFFAQSNRKWIILPKTIGSVLLGIGMASIVLIPAVMHNMGTGRSSVAINTGISILGSIVVFTSLLRDLVMPGIFDFQSVSYPGHQIYCSVEPFITLFGLLPTIVYWYYNHNRNSWLTWLTGILIVMYLTPLNGIFSGFTNPFYTRWLYGLNIFMILTILYVIKDNYKIPHSAVNCYVGFSIAVVSLGVAVNYILNKSEGFLHLTECQYLELVLFAINILFLLLWIYKNLNTRKLIFICAICGCFNLLASVYYLTSNDVDAKDDEIYRDYFSQQDKNSQLQDIDFTYRTDVFSKNRNIALLNNVPGIYGFHSSLNRKFKNLRNIVEGSNSCPTFHNLRHRNTFNNLFSVKYVRDYREDLYIGVKNYDGLTLERSYPDYDLYRYDSYIPIGFAYQTFVTEQQIAPYLEAVDSIDVPLLMLDNIIIKNEDKGQISKILQQEKIDPKPNLEETTAARKSKTVENFIGKSNGFSCTTDFKNPELVFFSVVNDPGFRAYIDDKETRIYDVNLGLMGIIVPSGHHSIKFEYFTPGLKTGIIVSGCCCIVLFLILLLQIKNQRKKVSA